MQSPSLEGCGHTIGRRGVGSNGCPCLRSRIGGQFWGLPPIWPRFLKIYISFHLRKSLYITEQQDSQSFHTFPSCSARSIDRAVVTAHSCADWTHYRSTPRIKCQSSSCYYSTATRITNNGHALQSGGLRGLDCSLSTWANDTHDTGIQLVLS